MPCVPAPVIEKLCAKEIEVGLIESILIGLQFDRLQKPLVFFSMLIGFFFFSVAGGRSLWRIRSSF
ncbi:hypothetical protein [Aliiglaciecola lipolytica]|uniref:hypothetical protein n=1 Tax=Aliiglaciecola lipolytica TaxID=477689 RepID=UPI001C098DED|nr:hypothetical protein [Aliiglaciecola lipolytica]MBU2876459.1 hypothetical protein [Aliiglaciecola lipolytica]